VQPDDSSTKRDDEWFFYSAASSFFVKFKFLYLKTLLEIKT
jgi:hypothetical protein